MKVLLTHGYFIGEDAIEQKVMRPYPPLGLLYISAFLEQKRIEHEVFDSTFSEFEMLCQYIQTHKPDFIGIYVNFLTRINILKTINFIKKEASLKSIKIILGGPDVRHNMDEYLKRGADYLVVGEGELTFSELIEGLQIKKEVKNIQGIAYLDDESQLVFTSERTHLPDLQTLPFPNRKK
ncbi:MAG: cobalamin-dependent protein [Bacteroidales bacterium]